MTIGPIKSISISDRIAIEQGQLFYSGLFGHAAIHRTLVKIEPFRNEGALGGKLGSSREH
jgi:hypothetical protein